MKTNYEIKQPLHTFTIFYPVSTASTTFLTALTTWQ